MLEVMNVLMLAEVQGNLLVVLNSIVIYGAELNTYAEAFEVSMKRF